MDIAQIAAVQMANSTSMLQQAVTMAVVKKQADAQMEMAQMIAQQAAQTKGEEGFSVYA